MPISQIFNHGELYNAIFIGNVACPFKAINNNIRSIHGNIGGNI